MLAFYLEDKLKYVAFLSAFLAFKNNIIFFQVIFFQDSIARHAYY